MPSPESPPKANAGPDASPGRWEGFFAWIIKNYPVAIVATIMLVGAGLYVTPLSWGKDWMPRDPIAVDAIPDIGEHQQIVFSRWEGRGPQDIEDQITYPLTTLLLGTPGVRTVRSSSAFGFSTIYLIFEDGVDFYWARSRISEKIASLPAGTLPPGVSPTLGPDATALGQVFWYTLEGQDPQGQAVGGWSQHELRSIQDWNLRFALQSVPGVSEVASVGGFVREYQIDLDPIAMQAHRVNLAQVTKAVSESNQDVGARTLEINRVEYVLRGLGLLQSLEDLEATVVVSRNHTPIRIKDIARVTFGPASRRGALDDEGAPAVGGVVVARYLENPLAVIEAAKAKIAQIQPGLPRRTLEDGTVSQVTIVPFYDRSTLIHETVDTLFSALHQEILITIVVVLLMLGSLRNSFLVSLLLPLGVAGAFVSMKVFGVGANVMALAGIAIAIGTMVDIGIVFVENISRHLRAGGPDKERPAVIAKAAAEVAPAVLTSVLTTIVSFLPVLGLNAGDLRLFAPLALTKTFAMSAAMLVALLVVPVAARLLRAKFRRTEDPEQKGALALLFHPAQLRGWLVLALGALLLGLGNTVGIFALLYGGLCLARPFLRTLDREKLDLAEKILVVVTLIFALSRQWMPLGYETGILGNFLFVALLVLGILLVFRAFERVYPRLLSQLMQRRRWFFALPALLGGWALVAWLGFASIFWFLPEWTRDNSVYSALERSFPGLGREYMPAFDEGAFLYMPTTMPHASIAQARELLSETDAAIAQIPEVDRVVGKIGRAETALDPAPLSMIETVITYHPEYGVDEAGNRVRRWRDHIRSARDIWNEILEAVDRPGLTGAPVLMPINARIVMLQSGMRAPMGVKVYGPSLESIEAFALKLQEILKEAPSLRPETVFADRGLAKAYLEIDIDRQAIGGYGLSVAEVQNTLATAIGGKTLTFAIEGRERYPVRIRYLRGKRDNLDAVKRVLVATPDGGSVHLSELVSFHYVRGPQVIKSEDSFLTTYLTFDRRPELSEVEAVEQARAVIDQKIESGELQIPAGLSFEFAGSYKNQLRSEKRLMLLVPLALLIIYLILYLQFRRTTTCLMVFSAVLVAVSGGFVLLWLYGQPWFLNFDVFGVPMRELFRVGPVHMSVAVWIGFIALVGIATDDGVVMSTYLKQSFDRDPPRTVEEIRKRVLEAGQRRLRPCLMTTATTILALLPVISSQGKGSDMMLPMALPCVGGMAVELLTLFVVPLLYSAVQERGLRADQADQKG